MRLGATRVAKYLVTALVLLVLGNIFCTVLNFCARAKLRQATVPVENEHVVPTQSTKLLEPSLISFVPTSTEVLHIGLVALNSSDCKYASLLVKSLLVHRQDSFHLHLVTNAKSAEILNTLLETWHVPYLNASFYDVEEFHPSTTDTDVLKLWLPTVVPDDVLKLVVLDVNIVAESDIGKLWLQFKVLRQEGKSVGVLPGGDNGVLDTRVLVVNVTETQDLKLSHSFPEMVDQLSIQIIISTWTLTPHCLVPMGPSKCAETVYLFSQNDTVNTKRLKEIVSYNSYRLQNILEIAPGTVKDSSGVWDWMTSSCSDIRRRLTYRVHPYYTQYSYQPSDATDVSMVTQLSFDRIHMLKRLLELWEGPISAALYVEENSTLELLELIHNTSVFQRTNLAIHVVYKKRDLLYPINFLRNVAWNYSNTPFVFLNDIDLLPCTDMYVRLKRALKPSFLVNSTYVVPAFQTHVKELQFPSNKQELETYMTDREVVPFKWEYYKPAHRPTDYSKWLRVVDPYSVSWKEQYEPYIVVRYNTTRYDERFAGYGENKVSHIMELHAQHYQFIVLPDVYVIHYPHEPSHDEAKFRGTASRTIRPSSTNHYYSCIRQMQKDFRKDLRKKYGYSLPSVVPSSLGTAIVVVIVIAFLVGILHAVWYQYCYNNRE